MSKNVFFDLVDELDIAACHEKLQDTRSGAIVGFTGIVRDHSKGRQVEGLSFEAYHEMAMKEMDKVAQECLERWDLNKLVMVHALGAKALGEPIVFTGASSAHREEAFAAARFLIDELKKRVPIWKKEYYTDKSEWVQNTP